MRVAVLGCGPAGMMAAWAAKQNGADVTIFAPGKKSVLGGAQYLHDEIPGIEINPMILDYKKFGTVQGYATKVYGSPKASCSWREFTPGKTTAYPLSDAYDAAWAALQDRLVAATVSQAKLYSLIQNFDLTVSSIPKPGLCFNPKHVFTQKYVYIKNKLPDGISSKIPNNTIIYNGLPDDKWYRASNIQGIVSTEYPDVVLGEPRKIPKPLENDCDCWPGVMHVGRYGKWKKGVLVHNAYWEVEYAVQSMQ